MDQKSRHGLNKDLNSNPPKKLSPDLPTNFLLEPTSLT